jgi:hypothetical protein
MEAMSPVFAARRRAEEFQALVEGNSTGRDSDTRFAEFLEIVGSLRETTPVTARPEFVAELREALLDEARTAARTGKGADAAARLTVTRSPSARRRERRLAVAVGGLAIVGATTGMSVAAQNALPGDPLYPLKRAIENAQTGVQTNDDAKGKALLDNASGRLEEVDRLSRESDDARRISDTLQSFTDQASEASDLLLASYAANGEDASVKSLRDFTAGSMERLTVLESLVPEDSRASLVEAAQTLSQIDHRALIACPVCGPNSVTQVPPLTNVALELLLGDVTQALESEPEKQQPAKPKDRKATNESPAPETSPEDTGTNTDGQKTGDKKTDSKKNNVVEDLKDNLTGKNGGTDQGGDDGGGLLENTTDGLSGLLGGILGN